MKKPGGGSSSGSFPAGPSLTASQKAARDRGEAANARGEAAKARAEAGKAGAEARRDEARARADRKRGENAYARQEMREARGDLARERRDLARAGRDQARAKRDMARARTAGLARPSVPDGWILGGNDRYLTCAAAAVANSLLLATGRRVSDGDVLRLHSAAAGSLDAEASVLGVLEAAQIQASSLNLEFSEAKFKVPCILELAVPGGIHAVLVADRLAVTWGRAVPVTQAFPEHQVIAAWQVTWGGV